jgi:hypothetical protein
MGPIRRGQVEGDAAADELTIEGNPPMGNATGRTGATVTTDRTAELPPLTGEPPSKPAAGGLARWQWAVIGGVAAVVAVLALTLFQMRSSDASPGAGDPAADLETTSLDPAAAGNTASSGRVPLPVDDSPPTTAAPVPPTVQTTPPPEASTTEAPPQTTVPAAPVEAAPPPPVPAAPPATPAPAPAPAPAAAPAPAPPADDDESRDGGERARERAREEQERARERAEQERERDGRDRGRDGDRDGRGGDDNRGGGRDDD